MLTQSDIEFIIANEKADTNRLLLNASKGELNTAKDGSKFGINVLLCVKCIEARHKIEYKIPLWYANATLVYPLSISVEQCSSEATALYKQQLVADILCDNCINIADITGGMGIDSYFLSLIAKSHYYIERNIELCNATKYNFKQLNANNITVINDEYVLGNKKLFNFLADKNLSLIYIDPARRSKTNTKVISLQDYEPNVLELKEDFFRLAPYLLIKVSPMADIKLNLKLLPNTVQIHIIAVDNECKELLFLMSNNNAVNNNIDTTEDPQIIAVNITANEELHFAFTLQEEESAKAIFTSTVGEYLFEPYKSVLKSGAYKLVSQRFGLKKLAPSTHLYTSDTPCANFPGKTFKVCDVRNFNKKELKKTAKDYPQASICARNFPLDTNSLKKISGIKDGGTHHIFAVTLTNGERKIICLLRK
ncbi:MAG: class I SAM-dependent methyltransferase [Bacteroidales bacterium]